MWKIVAAGVGLGGIGFAIWLYNRRRTKQDALGCTKLLPVWLGEVRGVSARQRASRSFVSVRARTGVYPRPRLCVESGLVEREMALGLLQALGLVKEEIPVYLESPAARCRIPRSREDLIRLGLIVPAASAAN